MAEFAIPGAQFPCGMAWHRGQAVPGRAGVVTRLMAWHREADWGWGGTPWPQHPPSILLSVPAEHHQESVSSGGAAGKQPLCYHLTIIIKKKNHKKTLQVNGFSII